MPRLQVWAPRAQRVDVELYPSGERFALDRADDAVFTSDRDLDAGTQYYLVVDDGHPRPDPRSRRQPLGVHGPSEIVDPSEFHWTDAQWKSDDARGKVFYELHIGTFCAEGTFRGAIEHLDYLADLGIEVVEIMPINPIPGERGWGYDGVSTMATFEQYGSPEDFAALVDALHARGLYACLDVVYNHFGPEGNYTGVFGPYTSGKHHTPWGDGMNLDDADSAHVRRFFIDNIVQWARDYHIDVFRLDAVDFLRDDSPTHIIAEMTQAIEQVADEMGKFITVTVESAANDVAMTQPVAQGGKGAHAQWVDDVHHALHVWLTGETNAYYGDYTAEGTLEKALLQGFVHDGTWSDFGKTIRGTRVPESLNGNRFIVFDENHDQVGNRLVGDRPSTHLSLGELLIARTLVLLSHFTPMLFMGEEWATTSPFPFFSDLGPDIGPFIQEGRKTEFATWDLGAIYGDVAPDMPDPQSPATFLQAKLRWDELSDPRHYEFFSFVKELIALRHSDVVFTSGDRSVTDVHITDKSGWMSRGEWLIVFAKSQGYVEVPTNGYRLALSWADPTIDAGGVRFNEPGVAIFCPVGAP
ncbi:MAG: malto-oligosyltrehalose trehalohydrolase [Actinomycetaceae bacterium]|nr:malto-oligosyltrehalose trehalohydrolase [Arcanobacterium sp.]MDD7505862.1 malto-oligosyltrehalose trehalohydrolase [Actinomycetaceae bacterium]MDY6142987.1 malto-oligosyltrehalose trehalohydrolase [Arcanobacterium sp.]